MSSRRLAPDTIQPAAFAFDKVHKPLVETWVSKYPAGRQASAVIPLLWEAQKQAGGWLPRAAIEHVAEVLAMPNIRVMEVATFYTMFNLEPAGTHFIQLCGTVPCHCMGAEDLKKVLKSRIGDERHVTADGKFSWLEVECLGACCNAPMVQINDDYFEDLTTESLGKLIDDLAAGKKVTPGPQNGRKASEPKDTVRTLLDSALYDGSAVGAWKKDFDARIALAKKAKEEAARAAADAAKGAAPAPAPASTPVSIAAAAPARPPRASSNARQDTPAAGGDVVKAKGSVTDTAPAPVGDAYKPELLARPRSGKGDDLELIWGVGPKLAAMLRKIGVYHFDQIAGWNAENLAWVDQNLEGFKGRARRDDWASQARKLMTGWRPENPLGDKPAK